MLDSPITSRPEARQLSISQSSEDDFTQVEEFVQKLELESGQSLTVKGNLRQSLGFFYWCSEFHFDDHRKRVQITFCQPSFGRKVKK